MFLVFVIALSPRLSFYITSTNTGTSMLVITIALISDYLWFKLFSGYVVMLNSTQDPNRTLQKKKKKNSICHWSLNSIAADNFVKLVLLKAYNSIHEFDIICLSETYLNSNILPDKSNLGTLGYNLVLSDDLYKNVELFIYTTRVICH